MKHLFPRIFFAAYGLGALGMAAVDVLNPHQVTDSTGWGFAPG